MLAFYELLQPAPTGPGSPASGFLDRWQRAFYLAASVKNAVILVRSGRAENMQLLLVDFETGNRIRLKSEGAHLVSPYLSPDGARLLFSRELLDRRGTELVSCDTSTFTCHAALRSAGSIHSAIEISGGRILYVSSPFVTGGDGRVRLSRNDIWMFDPKTGPRQLTDFRLYELHSLSVTHNQIYFSAYGAFRDRPVVPEPEPLSNQQSDIFRLPFDPEKATIDSRSGTLTPLLVSAGIATRATASSDGSLIAFLRTRTGINPYHFNLVIADQNSHTERLIESPGLGSSRPVIVDHDVYVSFTEQNRVLIQVNRQGDHSMEPLADIDNGSIAGAETVELKIEPQSSP
jgi:Tol biopolymer transport system component